MKISDNILKLYVKDLDVSGRDFSEAITLTGTKTESFERLDKNLEKIVVVKLLEVNKHPDADKLSICICDTGSEKIQIVTGAPNVYVGMLCPAVLVGGKVAASAHDDKDYPDGIKIKAGKLRGVESFGMLCSIDELGKSKDLYDGQDGIFDMSKLTCKPGDDALKVLGFDDTVYDFEITSNRIDCYSTIGIAREVAATFDKEFILPNIEFKKSFDDKNYISVDIEAKDLCSVFATRYIKNLRIKESPEWLKNYLRVFGIRPINNIVDITNLVMMECGQPLHAYDYDNIRDKKIIVKCASDGDIFTTLDGKERKLDKNVLTICDGKGIIGLAGIMGGENSMIKDSTKTLLLESANFDGVNIRLSSKRLGLRTEASNLFEKGLDSRNAIFALNRACALISELDAGDICETMIYESSSFDICSNGRIEIVVSVSKINSLLGLNLAKNVMCDILNKIDLVTKVQDDNLIVSVPSIRKDILGYADIAEEVMRFYGYDKCENTLPKIDIIPEKIDKIDDIEDKITTTLLSNGFSEAMNYSFEAEKVYDMLYIKKDSNLRNYIKIQNPLGEEFQIMRTQLVNGILKSLSTNYNKQNKEAYLYELANTYFPLDKEIKILPEERKTIILGAYGKDMDFFYMKGVSELILNKLNIKNVSFVKNENIEYMHPGRTANIVIDDKIIGYIGEVHEKVLKNYDIPTRIYLLEMNINLLTSIDTKDNKYKELTKFPKSERDLSMLVPKSVTALEIDNIITNKAGNILESFELFDIYEGNQVKDNYKSLTYNIVFSALDRSLTDGEVDNSINRIIKSLSELGIELRK